MNRTRLPNDFHWEIYKALNPEINLKYPWMYANFFLLNRFRRIYHINQVYPGFNCDIYRKNYSDLHNLDNIQLQLHWIKYGKNENRNCSSLIEPKEEPKIEPTVLPLVELTEEPKIEPIVLPLVEPKVEPINISLKDLWDIIDKVFYINLRHRRDRLSEINNEFRWAQIPNNKIIRIDAFRHFIGAIGCTLSHVKCLETAINMGLNNVLILEDDFNFKKNIDYLKICLNYIKNFNEEWDVILFSANVFNQLNYNDFFNKIIDAQTTAGYLVNSKYFSKLLYNFKEGLNFYSKKNFEPIDIHWKKLQPTDKWFIFKQKLGYQRPSFSNIENKIVKYNC